MSDLQPIKYPLGLRAMFLCMGVVLIAVPALITCAVIADKVHLSLWGIVGLIGFGVIGACFVLAAVQRVD